MPFKRCVLLHLEMRIEHGNGALVAVLDDRVRLGEGLEDILHRQTCVVEEEAMFSVCISDILTGRIRTSVSTCAIVPKLRAVDHTCQVVPLDGTRQG